MVSVKERKKSKKIPGLLASIAEGTLLLTDIVKYGKRLEDGWESELEVLILSLKLFKWKFQMGILREKSSVMDENLGVICGIMNFISIHQMRSAKESM